MQLLGSSLLFVAERSVPRVMLPVKSEMKTRSLRLTVRLPGAVCALMQSRTDALMLQLRQFVCRTLKNLYCRYSEFVNH